MSTEEALSFAAAVARRAEARPDDEVVRLAGSPGWTAAALWQRSLAIAGGLADLLEAGDTVATSVPLGPEAIAVTTAISALGAVEMPLGLDVDQRWARTLARRTGCVMTVATGDALRDSSYLRHLGRHATVPVVRTMLADHDRDPARVRHVVAGLPAPVDFQRGCAVRPPIMPGWDGYPVGDYLRAQFNTGVTVDNDVNLMALGEATHELADAPLLFIKVGAGIGAGIVTADGNVHRGADGAAGDIGHIRVSTRRDIVCRCGKLDCLEAVASHRAVVNDLGIAQSPTDDPLHASRELARRVSHSDAEALRRIRQAASDIGEVVAMLIHAINPRTLVLGGPLSEFQDELLSGVRAAVYEQALPLATRKLSITTSQLGSDAGMVGAVALALREVFSVPGVGGLLAET